MCYLYYAATSIEWPQSPCSSATCMLNFVFLGYIATLNITTVKLDIANYEMTE